ncbi:hypothetical protein V8G54_007868 [Vigna mungo]|uniref:Uncharacterized protein n=1 Tax=Vigna mungo TaxID=3915 RepID=A0AAQ3P213_VIGMU
MLPCFLLFFDNERKKAIFLTFAFEAAVQFQLRFSLHPALSKTLHYVHVPFDHGNETNSNTKTRLRKVIFYLKIPNLSRFPFRSGVGVLLRRRVKQGQNSQWVGPGGRRCVTFAHTTWDERMEGEMRKMIGWERVHEVLP